MIPVIACVTIEQKQQNIHDAPEEHAQCNGSLPLLSAVLKASG
jgi:hypothetical protein